MTQQTDPKRPRPYIWPSWITGILAGTDKCLYKTWYKAQHKYQKTADDADRAAFFREWTAKHDAIVGRRADELKAAGYVVKVEDEGAFRVSGSVDLSGKPDIVALHDDGHALVVDAKAGKRRLSDHWQVLLYIFALPLDWLPKSYRIRGEVEYSDGREEVQPMTDAVKAHIVNTLKKHGSSTAPVAVPSATECKYCDIANCPVRYKSTGGSRTSLF